MGTETNSQEGSQLEYIKGVHEYHELILYRSIRPWVMSDFIFSLTEAGKRQKKITERLQSFTTKVVEERKAKLAKEKTYEEPQGNGRIGAKRRLAFLDLLLEASRDGALLSDEEIREEVDNVMSAGHDTSGYALSYALWVLGAYPEVQAKAAAEQDAIFQGSDRPPTVRDLAEMKYLERVFKETLRLYSVVPVIGRQLTEDVRIGQYVIPAGCNISVQIQELHRDPEYFPNPEEFNPDNFLPEKVQGRHPYAYVPFSAGLRTCVGKRYAMLLQKTALSTLLRRFVVTSLDSARDIKYVSEIVLRPINGLRVRVERRGCARQ